MAGQTAPASAPSSEEPLARADGENRSAAVTPRPVEHEATSGERRADHARLGTIVDGFRLVELLGRGGAASVYRAEHDDGRKVAIKVLHPEHGGDSRARRRLLREAYVANRIGHPNVPRVLGDGMTADDAAYLIVELCEGKTLEAKKDEANGRIAREDLVRWADDLLDVLAVAHELGVVHRDIKPQNLMITPEGQLKVLDFGIARVTDVSDLPSLVTKTGAVLGTPMFMSPEQAIGYSEEIDARADLWAVGATLFTLLTGRYVHQARSLNEAIVMAATQKAPKIRSVTSDLPVALAAVVDRALAFDKEARFANARAMQDALRKAMRGETTEAVAADSNETLPESSVPRPPKAVGTKKEEPKPLDRRPQKSWLLGLAIIAVAAYVALLNVQRFSKDPPEDRKELERVAAELEAAQKKTATPMAPEPSATMENAAPLASAANEPAPPKQTAPARSITPPKAPAPGPASAPKASAPTAPAPSPTESSAPRPAKPRMY